MIATMNFNTKHAHDIGFYSLFAYLFHYASLHNLEPRVYLAGDTSLLKETFLKLGFPTEHIVRSESVDPSWYRKRLLELERLKVIEASRRLMLKCNCGKIFIPVDTDVYSAKRSLIKNELSICCNSHILSGEFDILQTQKITFPVLPQMSITVEKEIENAKKDFLTRNVVITKAYRTSFVYASLNGKQYCVDADMLNYLLPLLENNDITHILGGRNLVKHTVFFDFYRQFLCKDSYVFILLPKILHSPDLHITNLISDFGKKRVVEGLLKASMSKRSSVSIGLDSF